MKIQLPPMPFDWLSSDPDMVADCLEDDFAALLSPANYEFVRYGRDGKFKQHTIPEYTRKYRRAVIFGHHDPTTQAGYRYLETTVERMRECLEEPEPKLFFIVAAPDRTTEAKLARVEQTLAGRTRNPVLLTVSLSKEDEQAAAPVITLREQNQRRVTYSMVPTSVMPGGLSFRNTVDNDAIAELVLRHRTD